VVLLRSVGHDVVYVCEVAAGSTDAEVIAYAQSERRILLTEDKDFGNLFIAGDSRSRARASAHRPRNACAEMGSAEGCDRSVR